MSDRLLSPLAFVIVWAILSLLTILTVALSFVHGGGLSHVIVGESIGLVKASLVILFFMHVLRSPAQTKAVIAITVFWFIVVFLCLTFSDYLSRGMLPISPGH
jgi:cytochrome c oxidase subunit IV